MLDKPLPKYLIAILIIGLLGTSIPNKLGASNVHEDNYFIAQSPHHVVDTITLASKIDRIIFCESSGNPEAKNDKSSAHGLCQFLDKTWEYVENKWDMKLDRDNYQDQYYACKRLFSEEGIKHWLESQSCHGIYH